MRAGLFDAYSLLEIGTYKPSSVVGATAYNCQQQKFVLQCKFMLQDLTSDCLQLSNDVLNSRKSLDILKKLGGLNYSLPSEGVN